MTRRPSGAGPASPSRIDFDALARAALDAAERLVPAWLPGGKREGHEWKCGSLSGEAGARNWSCRVNLNTGQWADFATDDKGNDLISLYAAIRGLKQGDAARELARELGIAVPEPRPRAPGPRGVAPSVPSAPPRPAPQDPVAEPQGEWHDAGAWQPGDAPPPQAHRYRGVPSARWDYTDSAGALIGSVCRFETSDGGKEILPLVWSAGPDGARAWKWRQFSEPRPLFNGGDLAVPGDARPVLVVEGEKCAQLAQHVLGPGAVVTTWPGGCKAWSKAGWSVLAGRRVVIWPDADAKRDKVSLELLPEAKQPGMKAALGIAAELVAYGADVHLVRVPPPGERPDGWDVADLIAEAGDEAAAELRRWLALPMLRRPAAAEEGAATPSGAARASGEEPPDGPAPLGPEPDEDLAWRGQLLHKRGELVSHLFNVALILRHDPRWAGVIVFDEFEQCVRKVTAPPYAYSRVGEWAGDDDVRTVDWLATRYALATSSAVVCEAVEMVARERPVHPVRDWLATLQWDGVPRLAEWLEDFCHVLRSEYHARVGRYFLMGMVARVFEPGCKFDYCLVLEGPQGIGKSTALRTLGGERYSDAELDLGHKDSLAIILGKWLHEFSEMDAITRAESPKQKSFLSRQIDEFRPVYARRVMRVPRQVCFAGSTNEDEWARDSTGARRFWPVACHESIDTEGLAAAREQLFAEAVVAFKAGERFHPSPDEQHRLFNPEQARRVVQESLVDALHDWVLEPDAVEAVARSSNGGMFSNADACMRGLKLTAAQITRDMQTRVGKALLQLKCVRVEKRNGMTRYWYKAPEKAVQSTSSPQRAQPTGDRDDLPI